MPPLFFPDWIYVITSEDAIKRIFCGGGYSRNDRVRRLYLFFGMTPVDFWFLTTDVIFFMNMENIIDNIKNNVLLNSSVQTFPSIEVYK
jgi:hypothetical protein